MSVKLYECGICGEIHLWEWDGDCREDANRYEDEEDYNQTAVKMLREMLSPMTFTDRVIAITDRGMAGEGEDERERRLR